MNRKRMIGSTALFLLAGGAAAAGALAHEVPDGKPHKQKIIIMSERADGGGEGHARVEHRGSHMIMAECGGERSEFNGESAKGDGQKAEKARIVICTRGNASAADRAKRLESALARINANDELSAETKAKITTALREAIAQLNTGK
jgi:hypothetical protein